MKRYLLGRVAQFAIVIGGALLITFIALHIVGDPATLGLPIGTPVEAIEAFNETHGFDDPFLTQLGRFFWDALQGDFGDSLWLGGDSLDHVFGRLPATLMLVAPAVLGGGLTGVLFGSIAARRPDSALANGLNVLSYSVISIAEFLAGDHARAGVRGEHPLAADRGVRPETPGADPSHPGPVPAAFRPELPADPGDHGGRVRQALHPGGAGQGASARARSPGAMFSRTSLCRL